jgi:hypothetical protein
MVADGLSCAMFSEGTKDTIRSAMEGGGAHSASFRDIER